MEVIWRQASLQPGTYIYSIKVRYTVPFESGPHAQQSSENWTPALKFKWQAS